MHGASRASGFTHTQDDVVLDEQSVQDLMDGTSTIAHSINTPFPFLTNSLSSSSSSSSLSSSSSRSHRIKDWREERGGLGGVASRYGIHNSISLMPEAADETEAQEIASLHKPLTSNNIGFKLLKKMGWSENQGLGKHGQGRLEPIVNGGAVGTMGLGKAASDDTKLHLATEDRKKLESELQIEETEERKIWREEQTFKNETIKQAVISQEAKFFCTDCNKGYSTNGQWEEHCSSYDHHHRKRFNETKRLHNLAANSGRQAKFERAAEAELQAQMKLAQEASKNAPAAPTAIAKPIQLGGAKISMSFSMKPKGGKKFGKKLGGPKKRKAMNFGFSSTVKKKK